MGVIRRYFKRLAAGFGPRRAAAPAVSADAQGLRISGERVAWSDVRRLVTYKQDIYAGDFLGLAIFVANGRLFEINEESSGWKEAGDAIERFLPRALPCAEWTLQLLAVNPGASVEIYSVDRRPLNRTASRSSQPR